MSTKFVNSNLYSPSDFDDFEVCDRSTSVNYSDVKSSAVVLLESAQVAIGAAVKCSLRGKNIKPDDYFVVKKSKVTMKWVLDKLNTQEGYKETAGAAKTLGKDSSKSLVSISRLCKAFAPEVISIVRDGKVPLEAEIERMAATAGLPREYAFLDAPYGMDDDVLSKHGVAVVKFAAAFDTMIATAHKSGWCTGNSKRSHEKAATSYMEFRGVKPSLA